MDRNNIIVHFIKTFTYPKAMLDPIYYLEDAKTRGNIDLCESMKEVVNNEFGQIDANFFEIEVHQESTFEIRESLKQQYKEKRGGLRDRIFFTKTLETLTANDIEKKYGPLDIKKNPDIFVIENNIPFLKHEIEQEYSSIYEGYKQLLKKNKV